MLMELKNGIQGRTVFDDLHDCKICTEVCPTSVVCFFFKFGISHAAASIQDGSAPATTNHW